HWIASLDAALCRDLANNNESPFTVISNVDVKFPDSSNNNKPITSIAPHWCCFAADDRIALAAPLSPSSLRHHLGCFHSFSVLMKFPRVLRSNAALPPLREEERLVRLLGSLLHSLVLISKLYHHRHH